MNEQKQQDIYAAFESVGNETTVTVMADEWTPDYEGLRALVSRELDLQKLAEETDPN